MLGMYGLCCSGVSCGPMDLIYHIDLCLHMDEFNGFGRLVSEIGFDMHVHVHLAVWAEA